MMTGTSKRVAAILILGLTAFAAMAYDNLSSSRRTSDMSSDEKMIRNIIEIQYPGFVRSGDAQGYASQFTQDALWMPPGEKNQRGPQAIAESLHREFNSVQLRPTITIQELSILGDHAYAIGKDELAIIPKDGSAASHVVYTVFWFLRKADNQWKITRQIWNEKPAED